MIECISRDKFRFIDFFNELGKISKYNQVNSIERDNIKRIVKCFTTLYNDNIVIDPESFNARKDIIKFISTDVLPDLEIIFISGVSLKNNYKVDHWYKYFGSYDSLYTSNGTVFIFEDMFIRWIVDIHTAYDNNMVPLDNISDEEKYLLLSQKHFYTDAVPNLFSTIYYGSDYTRYRNQNVFINNKFYTERFNTPYSSAFLGQIINVDMLIILASIKRALKKANPFEDQAAIDMYMNHIIYNSISIVNFVNSHILDIVNVIDNDDFQKLSYMDKHLEIAERIIKVKETMR